MNIDITSNKRTNIFNESIFVSKRRKSSPLYVHYYNLPFDLIVYLSLFYSSNHLKVFLLTRWYKVIIGLKVCSILSIMLIYVHHFYDLTTVSCFGLLEWHCITYLIQEDRRKSN